MSEVIEIHNERLQEFQSDFPFSLFLRRVYVESPDSTTTKFIDSHVNFAKPQIYVNSICQIVTSGQIPPDLVLDRRRAVCSLMCGGEKTGRDMRGGISRGLTSVNLNDTDESPTTTPPSEEVDDDRRNIHTDDPYYGTLVHS